MTITRAQFPLLLEPKLSNIWHDEYPQWPVEYTRYLNMRTTQKATITDYKMAGVGGLRFKGEGENVQYDNAINGPTKIYQPVTYGLAYRVTAEMRRHELYGQIDQLERGLMRSAIDNQETFGALVLNNGFAATVPANSDGYTATGFDGLALFSTAHPRLDDGPTQANRPATDVDLGVTSLQNATIQFHKWRDERGRPIVARPRLLVVHPDDMYTAAELLKSEYKPGTANNDINELRNQNLAFMVGHYLTDSDAWFLLGDSHDLNWIWDVRPEVSMDTDFDSEDIKRKLLQAFSVGFGDWKGVYGSQGG